MYHTNVWLYINSEYNEEAHKSISAVKSQEWLLMSAWINSTQSFRLSLLMDQRYQYMYMYWSMICSSGSCNLEFIDRALTSAAIYMMLEQHWFHMNSDHQSILGGGRGRGRGKWRGRGVEEFQLSHFAIVLQTSCRSVF